MTEDRKKREILARRARFVAAALTTVGLGAAGLAACRPCLSPVPVEPTNTVDAASATADAAEAEPPTGATADAAPEPCLSPVACLDIADPAAPNDAGPTPTPCLGPKPLPCLKPLPPPSDAGPKLPPPHPCLSPMPKPQKCLSMVD